MKLKIEEISNDDLCHIIRYVEPLREKAWMRLLVRQPSKKDLRYIIEHVPSLREDAGTKLLALGPDDAAYFQSLMPPNSPF